MNLTDSQKSAVDEIQHNLQLIACAGSGKTEVISRRIAHILASDKTVRPEEIVAFTFTRKAAENMVSRIKSRLAENGLDSALAESISIGTIHAYCYGLLKKYCSEFGEYELLDDVKTKLFIQRYHDQCGAATLNIKKILETIAAIDAYMLEHGFELKKLVEASDFAKLALVVSGANAMCATMEIRKTFEIQARELFRTFKYVERKEVPDDTFHYKNAISAVYEQLQEKRKHADNSELMAQINEIVSAYVSVSKSDDEEDSKKFDISQIDFDRLRKEFERAQNKNLLFKDLQDIVEERLNKMMANNPLRTNYYERYQQIVDEYNKDNEKDSIAIIFENLMKLVNEMDAEQKRYVREGFDSDEELTMFDLLVKDSLSKEEIKKVKKLAQTMLAKIKARIHELDHWRDKEETQSIISVLIRDILWAELPESYDDAAIADYRNQIYEYVYNAYPAA